MPEAAVIDVTPRANTIGTIAARLGCPIHRVEYVIRSRHLKPAERAGNLRIFSEADVDYIRHELGRIDAEREEAACA
jgi:DNA-binding transcriptional MerR regulator